MSDAARAAIAAQRVLIVEDDESARLGLTELVRTWGFAVAAAADGEQAIELAKRFLPQMVLLDLGLPGCDGFDVARSLRSDGTLRGAWIVALTGWGAERDRARTAAAGFDDHLTKPVDPDALEAYLARFSRELLAGT